MHHPRVLIVDDDRYVRDFLSAVLSLRGVQVTTAADGREALAALAAEPRPHFIVLDLVMPGMSGAEFLEARYADPVLREIPVLILTAHDHEPVRLKNVRGVLRKSQDLHHVANALAAHCGAPA